MVSINLGGPELQNIKAGLKEKKNISGPPGLYSLLLHYTAVTSIVKLNT